MGDAHGRDELGEALGHDGDLVRHTLHDLGFFGHYLHVHAGGRSGKQHVLAQLLEAGGQLSQRALQDRFRISSAALSEVLSKLEGEGLVVRTRSPEDRRQLDIALTGAGRARAAERVEQRRAFEREAFRCLSAEELEQLSATLDRIVTHWESLEGKEATQ